jgi:hypothetical protein
MTITDAFRLINNLDVRDALRKYAPQWATVVSDRSGNVLEVVRFKESPTLEADKRCMQKYPGSIQFTTWQGQYSTAEALAARILEAVRTAERAERPENRGKKWIRG